MMQEKKFLLVFFHQVLNQVIICYLHRDRMTCFLCKIFELYIFLASEFFHLPNVALESMKDGSICQNIYPKVSNSLSNLFSPEMLHAFDNSSLNII